MKFRFLVVALCTLLVGCSFDMPAFDSGKLEDHGGTFGVTISALTQEQLGSLTEWFSTHQSGWKKSYSDAAPGKFVYLLRSGVHVGYFNLNGNVLYAASYSRILTPDEQQALEAILEAKKG
jgi:hypothetical protein